MIPRQRSRRPCSGMCCSVEFAVAALVVRLSAVGFVLLVAVAALRFVETALVADSFASTVIGTVD